MFRRELTLAPALVELVAPHARRGTARHLRFFLDGLPVHHSGEEELLRPLVAARVRHPGYDRGQIIAVTIFGYESDLQHGEDLDAAGAVVGVQLR